MKLKIAIYLATAYLVLTCTARPAEPEFEDEEGAEPPPQPPSKPVRQNPLLARRNPIGARAASPKSTTTTTTTPPPPPVEEEEEVEEEQPQEEEGLSETSSTTETGRKLKGGIVRPFRSNQDFLERLKKRREQVSANKTHTKPVTHDQAQESSVSADPKPEKPSKSRPTPRKRFSATKPEPANQEKEAQETAPATARTGRRFRN